MLLLYGLTASLTHAACSPWRSPQKVWFNEYFFGSGSSAPPNYLELYSTSNAYATQWQGSYVEVYSAANTKTTYTFTNASATACTTSNKTWITYNVPGGLRQQNALVILRDRDGGAIDAFVFDNTAPPAPWAGASANWAPGHTTGCQQLDDQLTQQAAAATVRPTRSANMLVLENYGNKDFSRYPDGGAPWDDTTYAGAGTTYTQCVSNNANLTKSVDNTMPTAGSTVTYTLALANTGNAALAGVILDDYLPDYPVAGAPTYVSATPVNAADLVSSSAYSATDPNTGVAGNATKITWSLAAVAGNSVAKLNIKMHVPGDATVGRTYTNIAQTTAGLTPSQSDFANITIGSPSVGSFVVAVSPATATTCTPAVLGPKVTITAMTGPNGTGSVDTDYLGASAHLFASSPNVKWYDGAGNPVSVAPVPAGSFTNGVASFYLTDATAETVSVTALDTTTYAPGVMQGASGEILFTAGSTGLALTDAESGAAWRLMNPVYGAVAGRPHKVRVTLTSCGSPATDRTGSYSGTVRYTAGLNHPLAAVAPSISTAPSCAGAIGPLSASANSPITLGLTNGVADLYLCTSDVGQFALNLTLNLTSPTASATGVSANFTVRPFAITASGFPASPSLAGGAFTGSFNAWRWLSAADTDGNGMPGGTVTPTMVASGNVVTPSFSGTVNNAGVVGVSAALVAPATCPAAPCACTLTPTAVTLSGGTATPSLGYTEAGSIKIGGGDATKRYAATNYLGAAALNVPLVSDTVRLIPAYFDTARTDTCPPGFVYSRQPFAVRVTARSALGSKTCGYDGAAGTAKAAMLTDGNALPATVGTLAGGSIAAAAFIEGEASTTPSYDFASPTTAPQTIVLRATESPGGDGVSSDVPTASYPAHGEASVAIRSGRVRLLNANGSELLDLPMPMRLEFWQSSIQGWQLNSADTCTGDGSAGGGSVTLAKSGTVAAATCAWESAAGSGRSAIGCAPAAPANRGYLEGGVSGIDSNGNAGFAGNFNLWFRAPGTSGIMDVTATVPAWLQYNWTGTVGNPTARAAFGVFRSGPVILRRELY